VLDIVAVDTEGATSEASFRYGVDAFAPTVTFVYPINGSNIPAKSVVNAEVSDTYLSGVWYSADGSPLVALEKPYDIDVSSWTEGSHTVVIQATDQVGHSSSQSVSFVIVRGSVAVGIASPADWSVIRSGVPIVLTIVGNGTIVARWLEYGIWHDLGTDFTISTVNWLEGAHDILVNASNDLGEYDELRLTIVIDDTSPTILLESPSNNSYVDSSDEIRLTILDSNLKVVTYTVWGFTDSVAFSQVAVPLASCPADGNFDVDVFSRDKAGNEQGARFSFAMDSEAPSISVQNLSSGSAIKPGLVLTVVATDEFLTTVEWSMDDSARSLLASPYTVDTSEFSSGWHTLSFAASDASGKQSTLNLTLYADANAPLVDITSSTNYVLNKSHEVTAVVSDDFGISSVVLYYELQDGSYRSVTMSVAGSAYVVQLTPETLWDGMTIYIVAEDKTGNICESLRLKLIVDTTSDNGIVPAPGNSGRNETSGHDFLSLPWLGSSGSLLMLGFIAVSSLLTSIMLMGRRRPSLDEDPSESQATAPGPLVSEAVVQSSNSGLQRSSGRTRTLRTAVSHDGRYGAAAMPISVSRSNKPTLLEAIPDILLKPAAMPIDDSDDDIDYGELIKRELNVSATMNSIYRSGARDADVNRESNDPIGVPKILSGLMLRRLLEEDRNRT